MIIRFDNTVCPIKKPVLIARLSRFHFIQFEYISCIILRLTRTENVREMQKHNNIIVVTWQRHLCVVGKVFGFAIKKSELFSEEK